MLRVLSWALNDVFELSWWYLAELSFGISASRESATVEELKSPIPSRSLSLLFPLNVFNFYFSEIKKKKKRRSQNSIVLASLMAAANWALMEYHIDKNWKLDDWNEKGWKLEGQFWIFALIILLKYYVFLIILP